MSWSWKRSELDERTYGVYEEDRHLKFEKSNS